MNFLSLAALILTSRSCKLIFCCISLTLTKLAMAAPANIPMLPQRMRPADWHLQVGYEGDFIRDARMKQHGGRIDNYRLENNSAVIGCTLYRLVEVYGVLGSSRTHSYWRVTSPVGITDRLELDSHDHFAWSLGGRAIIYQWGCTVLTMNGRYNASCAKPAWITVNCNSVPVGNGLLKWHSWQIDALVFQQIDFLAPYIGVEYFQARSHIGPFLVPVGPNGATQTCFKNRKNGNLLIGCTITGAPSFLLDIEGRLIGEDAFSITGIITF